MKKILEILFFVSLITLIGCNDGGGGDGCDGDDPELEAWAVDWGIERDTHGAGIHTISMVADVLPLEVDDLQRIGGVLIWEETEVILCAAHPPEEQDAGISVRGIGDGFLRIGDVFQSNSQNLEDCRVDTQLQEAFDDYGLPILACLSVKACGDEQWFCAPLDGVPILQEDLDPDFGQDGFVINDLSGRDDELYDMALQADGKIVVVGYMSVVRNDVVVQRYTIDGILDSDFADNGTFIFDGGDHEIAYAVEIQSDGKIIVVGYIREFNAGGDNILLIRLNSDGTLDGTFGTSGIVTTDIDRDDGYAVTLQNDGKIVIAGKTSTSQDVQSLVIRYNSDGTMDSSFGTDGVVTYDGIGWDLAKNVFIQPNDKIIVTGSTSAPYPDVTVTDVIILRYNSDGTLDNTFGTNGIVTFEDIGSESVLVQSDGRIVIGAGTWDPIPATLIIRLNSDGAIDSSFGQDGVVTYINEFSNLPMGCAAIAISDDGDIVIVGNKGGPVVIRVTHDGTFDTSFSKDGISSISSEGIVTSAAIQSDGSIVLAGFIRGTGDIGASATFLTKLTGSI